MNMQWDDYDIFEKDTEASLRYAKECFDWEAEQVINERSERAFSVIFINQDGAKII